jgi:glycosyltransferase involved in cell wall biosynthesis
MHVINIVLNNFTNDSRVLKTSKSLVSFGFDVTIVALYEKGLKKNELIGGLAIHRVELISRNWSKMWIFKFFKYLEFLLKVLAKYKDVKIVHCNDLESLPIGLLIKAFGRNVKVVYDCHEYQTEINNLAGTSKLLKKIAENFLIKYADTIITVSESISKEYVKNYGVPRPHVILNCPPYKDQLKKDYFRAKFDIAKDQKIFLYQGLLGEGRGVEIIMRAFREIEDEDSVIIFMGFGPLTDLIKLEARESRKIFFHESVPPDLILDYTSSADYGVSFIEDTCLNYRYCLPNKVFEYLMAGIPILASNLIEMRSLLHREGIGVVSEDYSIDNIIKAIQLIKSRNYSCLVGNVVGVRRKYCWEVQELVLKRIYCDLAV